ncbi:MAG TPA: hypothetical protein VLA24_17695 [Pseudomonadales bacterium]|nr:hypothetical protein [Pseudomonadales bacterium]
MDSLELFVFALPMLAGFVCSMTGLATLLNSNRAVRWRSVTGALLAHGLLGFAVACLVLYWQPTQLMLPMGLAVMIGLSGISAYDLVRMWCKKMNWWPDEADK